MNEERRPGQFFLDWQILRTLNVFNLALLVYHRVRYTNGKGFINLIIGTRYGSLSLMNANMSLQIVPIDDPVEMERLMKVNAK